MQADALDFLADTANYGISLCVVGMTFRYRAGAALTKGIKSPVAGRADILLVPELEAGNMLAKQLQYLAGADSAGIVLGARVPIVLTSRADNVRARLASTAVMKLLAHARRQKLMMSPR